MALEGTLTTWYLARKMEQGTLRCSTMVSAMIVPQTCITAAGEMTLMMQELFLLTNGPMLLGNLMALTKWSTSMESKLHEEAAAQWLAMPSPSLLEATDAMPLILPARALTGQLMKSKFSMKLSLPQKSKLR